MKVDRKIYKGIEYVQLNELPTQQQGRLLSTGRDLFIKILVDGKIQANCIQYKHYEAWYENVYRTKPIQVLESRIVEPVEIEGSLALNKV